MTKKQLNLRTIKPTESASNSAAWPHGGNPPKTGRTTITPEVAREWLKANRHNRPINQSAVSRLVNAIKTGGYQFNGQSIVFASGTWRLLDGQHRLSACVESGCSIDAFVVVGPEESSMVTLDNGGTGSRGAASAWMVSTGAVLDRDVIARITASYEGLTGRKCDSPRAFATAHDHFYEAVAVVSTVFRSNARALHRAPYVAAFAVAWKTSRDRVMELAKKYATGELRQKGGPMLVLRNHARNVAAKKSGGGTQQRRVEFSTALSLIDAALNGKTRAIVRDSESTVAFYRGTHGLKD